MKLEGSQEIAADRETVWAALNDPDVLRASIPGCIELDKQSETTLHAKVKQKIGPVSATFDGVVELTDLNPPESYRISGEGKGGAAGFAKGGADVRLEEAAGGTLLRYDVDAKVGGKIAQLGGRLIDGVAHKLANQFFDNFKAQVEGPDAAEAPPAPPPEAAGAAPSPAGGAPAAATEAAAAPPPPAQPQAEKSEKKGFWKSLFG